MPIKPVLGHPSAVYTQTFWVHARVGVDCVCMHLLQIPPLTTLIKFDKHANPAKEMKGFVQTVYRIEGGE